MNGSEFRATRFALGLSQAKMAARIRKGLKTVKQYENREYQPSAPVAERVDEELDIMAKKLEPFMALRAGQAARTLWLYSSEEELHQHQPEFSDWNIDAYNAYLGHAIVILKLRGVGYQILTPQADL